MLKLRLLSVAIALTAANAVAQNGHTTNIRSAQTLQQRVEDLEKKESQRPKFKVSGYIQAQFQHGGQNASFKVGDKSGEAAVSSYNRIGIRRGRIKMTYDEGFAAAVFQLDITENGLRLKDAYINLRDPWIKSVSLRAGVFDRPFGYEIGYSSSRRESPERSAVFQTLFPDERDLGAMLVLQAPDGSPWSVVRLEGGLFAGNGINPDTDSRKDFIGRLSAAKEIGNAAFGAGVSYYNGSVYQGHSQVFRMSGGGFILSDDISNVGRYARREYIGFDARFSVSSVIGTTQLRGEYIRGRQPAAAGNSKSPNYRSRPDSPTYIRSFSGGYAMLVQGIGRWPVSAVVKYDRYDPNRGVSGDALGENGTGAADVSFSRWGFGAVWDIVKSVRLQAYYERVANERSANLEGFGGDIRDDLFTLRVQYRF